MKKLSQVTLVGVDCLDIERLKLAANICQKDFEFGAVKLLSFIPDADPRVVNIEPISSHEDYSVFCIEKLADYIETDFALVIQYDGFILNPDAWSDEFLDYDYIGAPWYHFGDALVGNGGFSLRSKKLLKLIQDHHQEIEGPLHPEDLWICRKARTFLEQKGIRFAPLERAQKFSLEGNSSVISWNGQFGFHDLRETDISAWCSAHPEYKVKNDLRPWVRILLEYPEDQRPSHAFVYFLYKHKEFAELYEQLKDGRRHYEFRAWSFWQLKYNPIKAGDTVVFASIGNQEATMEKFEKRVKSVKICASIEELLRNFSVEQLYPGKSEKEFKSLINALPDWPERLKNGGILVIEV